MRELASYAGPVGVQDGAEQQVAAAYGRAAPGLSGQLGHQRAGGVGVGLLGGSQ